MFQVGPPKVLMKMDIEGSEIDVLPDVLFNGGLGAINGLMVEMKHEWMQKIQARKDAHKQVILRDTHFLEDNICLTLTEKYSLSYYSCRKFLTRSTFFRKTWAWTSKCWIWMMNHTPHLSTHYQNADIKVFAKSKYVQ